MNANSLIISVIAIAALVVPHTLWAREDLSNQQPQLSAAIINVAPTNSIHTKVADNRQKALFREIELLIFDFMYVGVQKTASILKKRVRPGMIKYNGVPLTPSQARQDAVKRFHQQILDDKYLFLREITRDNGGISMVYGYFLEFQVEKFLRNQSDDLRLNIYTYYLDSNAVGVETINLSPKHMNDLNMMKAAISKGMLNAFEDMMNNQAMLIDAPATAR